MMTIQKPLTMRLAVWIVSLCVFTSSVSVSAQNPGHPPLTNDDVIPLPEQARPDAFVAPVSQSPRTAAAGPLAGQTAANPRTGSTAEGRRDAELLADTTGTGGKVAGGVVVGVLTGMIGTAIGYFIIGPQAFSAEAALAQDGKTPDYQLGFKAGWAKKTKEKKRKAFLIGGALGSVASLAALVSLSRRQECGYLGTQYGCY